MYTPTADEKLTPVMIYTHDTVVRGDVVTKQNVLRVNIWLRTEGAPKYMHVLKPQVLVFGGSPVKALTYSEIFFPTSQVIGFHLLPPAEEALDYEANEANRMMLPVDVKVGTFIMKGKIRLSTQTDVASSLEVARVSWMSVYEVDVTNPYLPQMPVIHVPMMLVNPTHVAYALS